MKQYIDILRNILENGEPKQPVRFDNSGVPIPVENGTIGTFAEIFRHDMNAGFPLLTTKKVAFKTLCVELEGFIKGITSKRWYQERGCKIWNEWANPKAVEQFYDINYTKPYEKEKAEGWLNIESNEPLPLERIRKHIQLSVDDLGPIYGYQWRKFNLAYDEDDDGGLAHYDQFKTVCDRLRENPYDRRMVVSAWNPAQVSRMALPPCHYSWNVVVYGRKLNLVWTQRSCDHILGVPFNIASYGLLLLLLARHANLEPGILQGELHDCHVYENQIEGAKEQLRRELRPLPQVTIPNNDGDKFDIFKWDHTQVILTGYTPHAPIKHTVTVN